MDREIKRISLPAIKLDQKNVRFGSDEAESQHEAFSLLMGSEKEAKKILSLATHISENGLNPAELQIVIKDSDGSYIAVEGNRRLAALKLLKTPELCPVPKLTSKFKTASQNISSGDFDEIECAVLDSRETADLWIELLHTGENGGVGRVAWDGEVRGDFRLRRGGKPTIGRQIRTIINNSELFAEDVKGAVNNIPVTTLTRLFSSKPAHLVFKSYMSSGELKFEKNLKYVVPSLEYALMDFFNSSMTVDNVYTNADRQSFLGRIPPEIRPENVEKNSPPSGLPDNDTKPETDDKGPISPGSGPTPDDENKPPKRARPKPDDLNRIRLIPYALKIDNSKINLVYIGLSKQLDVRNHQAMAAIVFRIFLELSCDDYIKRFEGSSTPVNQHSVKPVKPINLAHQPSLGIKIQSVADHLVTRNSLKESEAKTIRRQANSHMSIGSIDHLNDFVHGSASCPTPRELNQIANNYELFIKHVWL